MDLTLREFENLNLYSHRNMEKVIRKLVNESYNAALVSMFDDSIILLDHEDGNFYSADYDFNEENLTLTLNNFENVSLVKEDGDFEEDIASFFEDDEVTPQDLTKSYKKNIIEQEKYIDDLISEVVSTKDFSNRINYGQIKEAVKEIEAESKKERFFKVYKERLSSHPLTEAKYFDWETPIKVSLIETEKHPIINTSMVEKAKSMWKRGDFKESFIEAVEDLEEDSNEKMLALFENFPVLFYLSEEDRLAVFGKTLLSSSFRERRKEIVENIETLMEEDADFSELKENYLSEAEAETDADIEDTTVKADGSEDKEDSDKKEKPEAELELTPAEMKKLVDDLKAVHEKLEDGPEKTKISSIIDKLSSSEEEGTKPTEVKEAVSLFL